MRGEGRVPEELIKRVNVGYLVRPYPAGGMVLMRGAVLTYIGCYCNMEYHCMS